jgi:hypothetical protein
MKLLSIIFFLLLNSINLYSQTIVKFDNMENTSNWRGVSTVNVNSFFTGGLSTINDNPANYSKYSSSDSCYTVFGSGLGSSVIEVDTFIYPNIPLISGHQYQIRFKLASFGINYTTQTAAGVDQTDWIELQYTLNNGLSWWRDAQIQGINNSMWSFDGAIGTNQKLNINRVGSTSTTTPTIYVSNAGNPIVNVSVNIPFNTATQLRIRFITRINAAGETFMLDDIEIVDLSVLLPVDLLNFLAVQEEEKIKIFWSTASEINNDYFIVYKSYDAFNFELFEIIDGNGNSNSLINYHIYDYDKYNGVIYYKLKQVDYDGNYKEYPIIAFDNRTKENKIIKILNYLGQEIDVNSEGFKIFYFEDGSIEKKYE